MSAIQTNTLIIGASVAGLAAASCLQKQGVKYIIIEKQLQVAAPWRNHYERLHLHTHKAISSLPYKKFEKDIPRYPSRQQVVDYLSDYQKEFNVNPVFNTEAISIKKEGNYWITQTNNGVFKSTYIVMATGAYSKPRPVSFYGMETFPGKILHSNQYKSGAAFKDQKVLVVGFGNSACEIAIDLYEQGAMPSMSVQSPVNIIPRDLFGIPILSVSQVMSKLPAKLADFINKPLLKVLFGDIAKLGLMKMPYGVFQQIKKDGTIPLLDIGTVKHIREGHIEMYSGISRITGKTVHFTNGMDEDFDAIVAAIGYDRNYADILDVDKSRFEDLKLRTRKQKYFGKDGLYFCGYWISPTGQIREIGLDAQRISKDIAGNNINP